MQQWNQDLAVYAQEYADGCTFELSDAGDRTDLVAGVSWVGEGLYGTSDSQYEEVAEDAVKAWYSESADYDYDKNSCTSGKNCGQYTQVI